MRSRGWLALLAISIGLNLFLGGLWVADAVMERRHDNTLAAPNRAGGGERGEQTGEVTPEQRQALRRLIRRETQARRPDLDAARQARREAAAAMATDPPNRPVAEAALVRARELERSIQVQVETALLDYVGGLPLADRQALAPLITRGMMHRRGETREPRPSSTPAAQ